MKTMKEEKGTLSEKIARCLLKHRATLHTSTKRTPAELFVGRRLRTRLDLLKPDMKDRMKQQEVQKNCTVVKSRMVNLF